MTNKISITGFDAVFSKMWEECEKANIVEELYEPLDESKPVLHLNRNKTDDSIIDYYDRLSTDLALGRNFAKERIEKMKQLYPKVK